MGAETAAASIALGFTKVAGGTLPPGKRCASRAFRDLFLQQKRAPVHSI